MSEETKKFLMGINEHWFNVVFLAVAVLGTYLSYTYEVQQLQILALLLLRVGIYLFTGSCFITFLNGIGFDVKKEIFEENNSAAAILTAGFWIGLAVAISVTI